MSGASAKQHDMYLALGLIWCILVHESDAISLQVICSVLAMINFTASIIQLVRDYNRRDDGAIVRDGE